MQNAAAMSTVSWISRSVAPVLAGACDVGVGHACAAFGDFAGDDEQRLQLVGDGGVLCIALDIHDELLVATEMVRGDRAVNGLTVAAVVPGRDERRNQLALTG